MKPEAVAWLCYRTKDGKCRSIHSSKRALTLCENKWTSQTHEPLFTRASIEADVVERVREWLNKMGDIRTEQARVTGADSSQIRVLTEERAYECHALADALTLEAIKE